MNRLLPSLAVAALLVSACGDDNDDGTRAVTELRPINDSGVAGDVELALDGEHLSVEIHATGLEPNRIHEQELHGFVEDDERAACPSQAADDDDRDSFVERREADDVYGPQLVAIEPFPTVQEDGELDYELTVDADHDQVAPLLDRVFVLKGKDIDSPSSRARHYKPDLPVACGELRPSSG